MNNKNQIQQLLNARQLSSDKEYELFENALEQLQGNINIEDIYEICKVFYDDTKDDEVMFEVVHLIEQLQGEDYIKCIVLCSIDMIEAHNWAMLLNKRIINTSEYLDNYIDAIKKLNSYSKNKIWDLLIHIKNDNPKKFGEKVDLILEKTT